MKINQLRAICAAVAVAIGLVLGATAAHAAQQPSSGSQGFGTVSYAPIRYHDTQYFMWYKLGTSNANCGGGIFSLRPFNSSNGNIIRPWVTWNISPGSQTHNIIRSWGNAPSQSFRLQGDLRTSCGAGPPQTISFNGTINY